MAHPDFVNLCSVLLHKFGRQEEPESIEGITVARVFTREEFYELVWSKPLMHLAKEFAISDVALHKICRKHDIPNPPLGWWAKKAAGKKVTQTPLPKAKTGSADRITIANADFSREAAALAGVYANVHVSSRLKAMITRQPCRTRSSSGRSPGSRRRSHPILVSSLLTNLVLSSVR